MEEQSFLSFMGNNLADFWEYTGFAQATSQHLIMILVGLFFLFLAIKKDFEPLLLVPIGFGILIGNIPFKADAASRGTKEEPRIIAEAFSFKDSAIILVLVSFSGAKSSRYLTRPSMYGSLSTISITSRRQYP